MWLDGCKIGLTVESEEGEVPHLRWSQAPPLPWPRPGSADYPLDPFLYTCMYIYIYIYIYIYLYLYAICNIWKTNKTRCFLGEIPMFHGYVKPSLPGHLSRKLRRKLQRGAWAMWPGTMSTMTSVCVCVHLIDIYIYIYIYTYVFIYFTYIYTYIYIYIYIYIYVLY